MGIAMLCAVFLISNGISDGLKRNSGGIDVVAGAKGSPLQLILSIVYHTDVPIGNIEISELNTLKQNPMVRNAIPIVVGDNFKGWRVVGTTSDYFDLYHATPSEGRLFTSPFEVVAGANTDLKLGQEFAAHHGFAADSDDIHDYHLYKVVGKLAATGTVIDRLLLTPYESVQQLHAHLDDDEKDSPEAASELAMAHQITAILIKAKNRADLINLPRLINKTGNLQAANPGYELARLSKSLGLGRDVINALGASILILSILMLFSTLASSLSERRHDMAVLRIMGASPTRLFLTLMSEGMLIAGTGSVLGLIAGHAIAFFLSGQLGSFEGLLTDHDLTSLHQSDIYLLIAGCVSGLCAACPAALSAARTDIARLLVKG
jgi:putative ABC transport system permease protein